jgi:hypothetical protein
MLTPLLDGTVREALMCAVDGGLTRVSILPAVHGTLPGFLAGSILGYRDHC